MSPSRIPLIALALLSTSCGSDDLPDYFLLGGLRVLALQAERTAAPGTAVSEVDEGDGVTVTALISDLDGKGRNISWKASACLDPGVSGGAEPDCGHDPTATSSNGTFTVAAPDYTEAGKASFSFTVPAALFTSLGSTDAEKKNGVPYLVTYEFSAGDDAVRAFRRVYVSSNTRKNAVPSVSDIRAGTDSVSELPGKEQDLKPVISSGAAEEYTLVGQDGRSTRLTEEITTTWFVSRGELERARTDSEGANTYTPSKKSSSKPDILVVVVRDSRGGVAYYGVPGL